MRQSRIWQSPYTPHHHLTHAFRAVSALLLVTGLAGCLPAEQPLTEIDSVGVWTLPDLGYADLTLPIQSEKESVSVRYRLPENAAQGPDAWYMIHLHFIIEFSEASKKGSAYVSALTNDYACALIEFRTARQDGSLVIGWQTANVFGPQRDTATSPTIEIQFDNYLQVFGVQPGNNILTFEVEQYGGARVKSFHVLDDTAIKVTREAPPRG